MKRVDAIHSHGYTLFKVDGENVLGYQKLGETYYFIRREAGAFSTNNPDEAKQFASRLLREKGADLTRVNIYALYTVSD